MVKIQKRSVYDKLMMIVEKVDHEFLNGWMGWMDGLLRRSKG
jgi:hypothetical protein